MDKNNDGDRRDGAELNRVSGSVQRLVGQHLSLQEARDIAKGIRVESEERIARFDAATFKEIFEEMEKSPGYWKELYALSREKVAYLEDVISNIRDLTTTAHESKSAFIARVNSILPNDKSSDPREGGRA